MYLVDIRIALLFTEVYKQDVLYETSSTHLTFSNEANMYNALFLDIDVRLFHLGFEFPVLYFHQSIIK